MSEVTDIVKEHTSGNFNFSIPNSRDDDVLLKIQKKHTPEPKVHKFRSFCIPAQVGEAIVIGNKSIAMIHLFNILKQHGLCSTLPMVVSLNPVTFTNIDWKPVGYSGPTVWYFKWNEIECSITSQGYSLYIRVHDLSPGVGERVIDEIIVELLKHWKNPVPNKSLSILTTQKTLHGYQWVQHSTRIHRELETIYINPEIKEKLMNQLKKFLISGDMYDRYGVTWKRVHLFHGPPGSGKTSTILALASFFNVNIAKLTLTPHLNSQDIESLFQTIPANTWLLLEDVDGLFTERTATTSVDFSTLLNCMDGITTRRGLVLFMTTNHKTKLDAAFIRPGRVDLELEFKLPGKDELREALKVLGADYAHEHEEFLEKHAKDMSIASLQKHLFECIMEEKKSIL